MRLLSLIVFMSGAVWGCALFVYQWHHDDLTAMETLKATPDALAELPGPMLLMVIVGSFVAWRSIDRAGPKE